jgi:hypothetical protein
MTYKTFGKHLAAAGKDYLEEEARLKQMIAEIESDAAFSGMKAEARLLKEAKKENLNGLK